MLVRISLVACVMSLGLGACSSGPAATDESSYHEALTVDRAEKDREFKELPACGNGAGDACSPVPPDKRAALLPLRYYAPDSNYSVPAALKLNDDRPVFEIPTSTGVLRKMQLVGTLQFSVQGQPQSLGAFVEDGTVRITTLFVPFADTTTGSETYSAGRYLDIHPTSTGYYTIDFNRAYNPYCAYNSTYECPFPPASNRLKLAIRAGEKAPGA